MADQRAEILKQDESESKVLEAKPVREEQYLSDQMHPGDASNASERTRVKRKAVKVEDDEREDLYSASPPPKRLATPVSRPVEPNQRASGQEEKPNGDPPLLSGKDFVDDDELGKEMCQASPTVAHARQDRGKFRASITEDDRGMMKLSKRINSGLASDFVHAPLVVEYEPSVEGLPNQAQKIIRCQIRLLELEPSQDPSSPIQCTLRHVFVDESPAFKALSYVWGEAFDTLPIHVDGKSYEVTTNCHAALQRLRLEKEMVCLWIDSICINQADLKEKSFQIVLMRDIYSMADEVFVWLGNTEHHCSPSDESYEELAITLIKDLVRSPEIFSSPQAFIAASTKGDVAEARWRALGRTFQHPWFERLWVHQEIIVAKAVKVLGATYCMRWELLAVAALAIEQNARILNTLSDETENNPWSSNLRLMIAHSGHLNVLRRCWPQWFYNREKKEILDVSLLQILQNTRHYKCQNPLDKCFAIFGLVSESKLDQNLLHPDYSFSINLLYTYVAWHIIRSSNSLEILCLAGLGNHNRSVFTGLPSWVVDWREDGSNQPYQFNHEIYNAVPDPGSLSISFSKEKLSLALFGSPIDKVILTQIEDGGDFWKGYALDQWRQNFLRHPARCDAEEAWLRTVTADIGVHEGQEQRMTDLNLAQIRTFLNIGDLTCTDIEAVFPKDEQEYGSWSAEIMKAGAEFARIAARATHLRAFFISRTGYMGIGPLSVKRDDMIWLFPGCKVPLVVRKIGDDHYLVGECFAWGLMGGAGVDLLKESQVNGVVDGAITTGSCWAEMELR